MSYEGYVQCICSAGHFFSASAYDEKLICSCGKEAAWHNNVDDTNCDEYGVIPVSVIEVRLLLSKAKVETCNLGHKHVMEPAIYRVPTLEETEDWRCVRKSNGYQKLKPRTRASGRTGD